MAPIFAIYLLWFVWGLTWFAAALWAHPHVKRAGALFEVLYKIVMFVAFVLLFGLYSNGFEITHRFWYPLRGVLGWSMFALVVVGFLFSWWARISLGLLWSGSISRMEEHHIVDTGPYAIVRHPIYAAAMLAAVATALTHGILTSLLGAAILTAGWTVRARLEERFLREELGPGAYDSYAERVPMLVPFAH